MNLSPLPVQKFFDNNGRPLVSGLLFSYAAGTSVKIATYTDASGSQSNTNPVVLDFRGEANVWLDPELTYKFVLSPANDTDPPTRPIWTVDDIPGGLTLTQDQFNALLIASPPYVRTPDEVANGVVPTVYTYLAPDIRRYGATGDGVANDSAAFASALLANTYAYVPQAPVSWRIETMVTIPDNKGIRGVGLGSLISKGANITMFSMGRNAFIEDVFIDGKGATYTGVSVTIPFTAEFEGFQLISRSRLYDSESYAVQYVSGTGGAGFGSKIVDCDLRTRSDAVECIQWGADPVNTHGNRSIVNCAAGSGSIVDCNTADNGFVIACLSGDGGGLPSIKLGAGSAKIIIMGNRLAAGAKITIAGSEHQFIGNEVFSDVDLAAGSTGCSIGPNKIAGTFTDLSGGGQNTVFDIPRTYTPVWTAAVGNPVLGDGTINGYFTRNGRQVTLTISLDMGATTTFGTGEWRISLPAGGVSTTEPAWLNAMMYDASATPVMGLFYIGAGSTYGVLYMQGVAGTADSTHPFVWASGDFLRIGGTYLSG